MLLKAYKIHYQVQFVPLLAFLTRGHMKPNTISSTSRNIVEKLKPHIPDTYTFLNSCMEVERHFFQISNRNNSFNSLPISRWGAILKILTAFRIICTLWGFNIIWCVLCLLLSITYILIRIYYNSPICFHVPLQNKLQ